MAQYTSMLSNLTYIDIIILVIDITLISALIHLVVTVTQKLNSKKED